MHDRSHVIVLICFIVSLKSTTCGCKSTAVLEGLLNKNPSNNVQINRCPAHTSKNSDACSGSTSPKPWRIGDIREF